MSRKSAKVAAIVESFAGAGENANYLAYFECFNRAMYYEAHDVLEVLWLKDRHGPSGNFYKGLIQFAGGFVHMQRDGAEHRRLRPAARLLGLARANLAPYAPRHLDLDVEKVLAMIDAWVRLLETNQFASNPLATQTPRLELAG